MTKQICFFHRNSFHEILFPKIGKYLEDVYGYKIFHVSRYSLNEYLNVFNYEKYMETIWNDMDLSYERLASIEMEYPTYDMMRAIYSEREFNYFPKYYNKKPVPYEEQIKYLIGCLVAFENFIKKNKIELVLSELPQGIPDVFQAVCERYGVMYRTMRASKITPGTVFCQDVHEIPVGMLERYKNYLESTIPDEARKQAIEHIESIREKINLPAYMEITGKKYRLLTIRKMWAFLRAILHRKKGTSPVSINKSPLLNSIYWNIHRTYNIWNVRWHKKTWFFNGELPKSTKYFVFTLQYEPENSTSVRAYPFFNQMCVIEQIAKALPLGVILVVKEHKGNQGYRKGKFYKELSYLPNVKLVDANTQVSTLVKNSIGVITLTSRMGWEAIVMRKPVIVIGTTFYSSFEYVKKPKSWGELRSCIREIVSGENYFTKPDYEEKLIAYCASYITSTKKGFYIAKSEKSLSEKNAENLATAIVEMV